MGARCASSCPCGDGSRTWRRGARLAMQKPDGCRGCPPEWGAPKEILYLRLPRRTMGHIALNTRSFQAFDPATGLVGTG